MLTKVIVIVYVNINNTHYLNLGYLYLNPLFESTIKVSNYHSKDVLLNVNKINFFKNFSLYIKFINFII
jgi:hypothetical protein